MSSPSPAADLVADPPATAASAAPAAPTSAPISAGPAELETGGILTIDLSAIVANWRALASRAAPAECAAVVKADAYGCGVAPVSAALKDAGCHIFFVASLAEARELRALAPMATIYALSGLPPGAAAGFAEANIRPVLGSLIELAEWDAFRAASDFKGGCALHFDTGMSRLGLTVEEGVSLAVRLNAQDHGIALIMSHFACSDTPAAPLNARQIDIFRELRMLFRGVPASLANSSGVFLGASAHCDLVRPGYALYGGNPLPGEPNPMTPVVDLKARIVQIRHVDKGATVGYGAAWTAERPSRIAILSVGYADGYVRAGGGGDGHHGAQVIVAGRRAQIVGRISMDLTAIDVTDLPDHAARRGDLVTLIGGDITIDDLAGWSDTIGYEVLTNLGARYRRLYTS